MDAITTAEAENPYATFPSVPRTASINGFADRIYDQLPECAKACMFESTGSTPCPYWDTGCLCVMPQFGGAIGQCVADNCQGEAIGSVEYLATSICSSAGVWDPYWFIPDSVAQALAAAAAVVVEAETTPTSTAEEEGVAATTNAQEGSSVDAGVGQPTETSAPEEETQGGEEAEGEGEGEGEVEGESESESESEEEAGEEQVGEEEGGEKGGEEGSEEGSEEDSEEEVGAKEEETDGAKESATAKEEGKTTNAPTEEEDEQGTESEKTSEEKYSTSIDAGDNSIDADAEAASIEAQLENGAVAQGVAMGGIIAALAALI